MACRRSGGVNPLLVFPGIGLAAVEADDLPELRSLAAGIRSDLPAVTNGLTLPYSSGKVEGAVNKIKTSNGRCMAANLELTDRTPAFFRGR